ncbi:HvfC/BufC N-terminal domain-containing protein [Methyloversatilis thermotolerans]|uniref:HvfC/BufC N-terminal domain-containing protein n=1 Tax=Methyloversatilis thermotolerans TaxID=1346290 RepID=UPI00036EAA8D|nr:DNA-binding domain-containing protein [Methyloversatilis thermotolerans]
MSTLLESQRLFAAALLTPGGDDALLHRLSGEPARNRALLSIYRRTSIANAVSALELSHPVCARLVGAQGFEALVRHYRVAIASRDGDLNRYGLLFADFLDGFEPARALPYLPDVARLEWRVHAASMAADCEPADHTVFAASSIDELAVSTLRCTPGFALLESAWPVVDIWSQHQESDRDPQVELARGECAVVWREGLRVRVIAVTQAEHAFWAVVSAGGSIEQGWHAASALQSGFDLAASLAGAIAHGWLAASVREK